MASPGENRKDAKAEGGALDMNEPRDGLRDFPDPAEVDSAAAEQIRGGAEPINELRATSPIVGAVPPSEKRLL